MPKASKTFEFEGCLFECTIEASFSVEHHPYGSTTAAETIMDMDDIKWTWDGAPISEADVETLVGDVEDWINQTAELIDQSEDDYDNHKADEDLDR